MSVQERELIAIKKATSDFYFETPHFQHPLEGFGKTIQKIEPDDISPEYTLMSPSDLEIIEKISELSDFDEANPSFDALKPSESQAIGALTGFEGHLLDYLVTDLAINHMRIFKKILSSNKRFTNMTRFPTRLLAKHDGLNDKSKVADRKFLDKALAEARQKYRLYRLVDIPQIVDDIRISWRNSLQFSKTKGNKRSIVEGWEFSPDEMLGFWTSDEVKGCGKKVLEAYENKFARGELPLEVQMMSLLQNELEVTMKLSFPYFNMNLSLRADYVLKAPNGQVVVIDNKFSPWESDTMVKRLQRFLYLCAVNSYTQTGIKHTSLDMSYEQLDPGNAKFIYKVFDVRNPVPTYDYLDYSPISLTEVAELKDELNIWATQWWFKHKDYARIKKIQGEAFPMPKFTKLGKEMPYQKRLF